MTITKLRRLARRNPMSAEMTRNPLFRTRIMASANQFTQKRDPWDRTAKHKQRLDAGQYHDV